jgi:hypothetical protein
VGKSSGQVADDPPGAGRITALRRYPKAGGIQGPGNFLPRSLREFGIVGKEGLAAAGHDRAHDALCPALADPRKENLYEARFSGLKLGERTEERQQGVRVEGAKGGQGQHELARHAEVDEDGFALRARPCLPQHF